VSLIHEILSTASDRVIQIMILLFRKEKSIRLQIWFNYCSSMPLGLVLTIKHSHARIIFFVRFLLSVSVSASPLMISVQDILVLLCEAKNLRIRAILASNFSPISLILFPGKISWTR
jgi:hypothetical protein